MFTHLEKSNMDQAFKITGNCFFQNEVLNQVGSWQNKGRNWKDWFSKQKQFGLLIKNITRLRPEKTKFSLIQAKNYQIEIKFYFTKGFSMRQCQIASIKFIANSIEIHPQLNCAEKLTKVRNSLKDFPRVYNFISPRQYYRIKRQVNEIFQLKRQSGSQSLMQQKKSFLNNKQSIVKIILQKS